MIKSWTDEAWEDYLYWQVTDKKVFKRINALIKDIDRNAYEGIGKPEYLRYELSGHWSRHITEEHRLVYRIDGSQMLIVSCRLHYGK